MASPSLTLIGPCRPEPTLPDFPSTPSNSTLQVKPNGSGRAMASLPASCHPWTASWVNSFTCKGHVWYGCLEIIERTILKATLMLNLLFSKVTRTECSSRDISIFCLRKKELYQFHREDALKDEDVAMPIQTGVQPFFVFRELNLIVMIIRSLTSLDGKPWTIICMTQGRLCLVFHAPCVISPLCCLSKLSSLYRRRFSL